MADPQVSKLSKPKFATPAGNYDSREAELRGRITSGQNTMIETPTWVPGVGGAIGGVENVRSIVKDAEMVKQDKTSEQSRLQRELDLLRGEQRGEQFFGTGALGRVDEGRGSEISDILAQRKQMSQEGLGADVFQAEREARLAGLARGEQAQNRQLQSSQAAGGVTGGMAQAQMLRQQEGQQQSRQSAERQLMLDSAGQKTAALGDLERGTQFAREEELGREKFNLQQNKAELQGRLTSMYGEAALGVSERSAAGASAAAKEYARASAAAGGGGKK